MHASCVEQYALGLNYAWAAEFIELTNGNAEEQRRTAGTPNT
jgi:hypothetical protein